MKWPRQYSVVTVIDNETGEESTGNILQFTKELIIIRQIETFPGKGKTSVVKMITFDAMKVHFKEDI